METKPRLKDVARRAGVHLSTVSLALRNAERIPLSTRRKIQALAAEIGYTPDPMLTGLAAYRQTRKEPVFQATLGILSERPELGAKKHHAIKRYFEGVADRAKQLGWQIDRFPLNQMKVSPARLTQILESRNIRGLIIAPRERSRDRLKLDWSRFSAVTFGYSLVHPPLHRITSNYVGFAVMTMRRLRQLGYRRIGFAIAPEHDERVNHGLLAGYSIENHRIPVHDRIPWFSRQKAERTLKNFRAWFLQHRPDVLVFVDSVVEEWLIEMNIKIPEQVGLVNLNLPDQSGETAGMYENGTKVGATAVDLLVGMLQRNERGIPDIPTITLIEGTWIEGKTICSKLK